MTISGLTSRRFCVVLALSGSLLLTLPVKAYSATADSDLYSEWGGANTPEAGEILWQQLARRWFDAREIQDDPAHKVIRIEAPERAENDAMVPVRVSTATTGPLDVRVRRIYLTVDINPDPLAARFTLSDTRPLESIETRVRVNGYTYVRAVAELEDGRLFMDKQWVKSRGAGCSAPPGTDQESAKSNMGTMRFRMLGDHSDGEPTKLQLMISHPNSTGMQRDQLSTRIIPQHYVDSIEVSYDDELLLQAETSFTLSENPSFRFDFSPDDRGTVKAVITDTRGQRFVHEHQLGAGS